MVKIYGLFGDQEFDGDISSCGILGGAPPLSKRLASRSVTHLSSPPGTCMQSGGRGKKYNILSTSRGLYS